MTSPVQRFDVTAILRPVISPGNRQQAGSSVRSRKKMLRAFFRFTHYAEPTFTLVSHVDITWNSFLPYLVTFADRLEDFGFRRTDGEVFAPRG